MRRARLKAVIAIFAASVSMLAANAVRAELTEAQLGRLGHLALTLSIERDLDAAIRSGKSDAVDALQKVMLTAEPGLMTELLALGVRAEIASKLPDGMNNMPAVTMKLGPCHYAGITIRILTAGIASESFKPKITEYGIVTKPSKIDLSGQFAEKVWACEQINRHPKSDRKVGSTCVIDGRNCDEDDD
jgi:hypothetical protein